MSWLNHLGKMRFSFLGLAIVKKIVEIHGGKAGAGFFGAANQIGIDTGVSAWPETASGL